MKEKKKTTTDKWSTNSSNRIDESEQTKNGPSHGLLMGKEDPQMFLCTARGTQIIAVINFSTGCLEYEIARK